MKRIRRGTHLARALSDARKAAEVLTKNTPGGVDEKGNRWFYASPEDVARESDKLLDRFGLEIQFRGQAITPEGYVRMTFRVLHLDSMEGQTIQLVAPPNEPGPVGVSWTMEHSRRLVRVHVLNIRTEAPPVREEPIFNSASGPIRHHRPTGHP